MEAPNPTPPDTSATPTPYSTSHVSFEGAQTSHDLLTGPVQAGARVLDVGCGWGHLGEVLSARGCTVTGIELDPASAARAEERCSRVIVGSIESEADRAKLGGPFDTILCGDVLEHLRRPDQVLVSLRGMLAPDGFLIASIPNIAVWRGRVPIARGRFDYVDSGLFDRTHLRFFTRRTIHDLVEEAGFRICDERFTPAQPPFPLHLRRVFSERRLRAACQRLANLRPELFALQVVMTLRPLDG